MKKRYFLSLTALFVLTSLVAQVPKKVVLEHYSNTLCSICSSQNPKINANLENNPSVLHLSIHPSRPYSACILNKHNVAEQDGRTKAYGIFGGTPRLVIQGEVVPTSANYGSSSIFTPHKDQMSPASIRIKQQKFSNDSIRIQVVVKTEAAHSLGKLSLFAALAEDTIFYNAPNGEKEHYNVFRKTVFGGSPEFELPSTVGDSVVFTGASSAHADWQFDRIFAMVLVQEVANQKLVQVESTTADQSDVVPVGVVHPGLSNRSFTVFPNPATQAIVNVSELGDYTLLDVNGKSFGQYQATNSINVGHLQRGIYFLRNERGKVRQFIK